MIRTPFPAIQSTISDNPERGSPSSGRLAMKSDTSGATLNRYSETEAPCTCTRSHAEMSVVLTGAGPAAESNGGKQ